VAAEVAAPLAQTKKVTMVSMGKGDVGAAKLTTEVLNVVERIPNVVEGLTGVTVTKVFHSFFNLLSIQVPTFIIFHKTELFISAITLPYFANLDNVWQKAEINKSLCSSS